MSFILFRFNKQFKKPSASSPRRQWTQMKLSPSVQLFKVPSLLVMLPMSFFLMSHLCLWESKLSVVLWPNWSHVTQPSRPRRARWLCRFCFLLFCFCGISPLAMMIVNTLILSVQLLWVWLKTCIMLTILWWTSDSEPKQFVQKCWLWMHPHSKDEGAGLNWSWFSGCFRVNQEVHGCYFFQSQYSFDLFEGLVRFGQLQLKIYVNLWPKFLGILNRRWWTNSGRNQGLPGWTWNGR